MKKCVLPAIRATHPPTNARFVGGRLPNEIKKVHPRVVTGLYATPTHTLGPAPQPVFRLINHSRFRTCRQMGERLRTRLDQSQAHAAQMSDRKTCETRGAHTRREMSSEDTTTSPLRGFSRRFSRCQRAESITHDTAGRVVHYVSMPRAAPRLVSQLLPGIRSNLGCAAGVEAIRVVGGAAPWRLAPSASAERRGGGTGIPRCRRP